MKKIFFILIVIMILALPSASSAYHKAGSPGFEHPGGKASLVPTCPEETGCGWKEAMQLVSSIINFLLFYISLPLAALLFAYAGFIHMTAGDNVSKRTEAWKIFKAVGKGLIIALAAWLIVSAILSGLGVKKEFILLEGVKPE
ncbi:hypothetical protein A3A09_02440 [Candidatus Nomurabacteria bacterium RIFCSPLOWO2_01_FULL_42_20]|uniref:Interferon-induced transmembrane protein n=1 Tax=Candidatus Nomurabacteria bacterium RIFCSPHIGHO2_01_FULL_42_16 TaxID=1801743 RepID=A0A1F6VLJ9_9BACT|nr:MAG: hypothetical protein A2824_01000 [Candidatus Nomurabacteria bacterium RIFCSPHIGHO2_01_FULL_42_16]OGI92500.1 MAG: hypothetical protein A3A09_02440 [Candidatus Nomurabacteria bacterium RIFCSPLOWO2_01_FULL_42_20]